MSEEKKENTALESFLNRESNDEIKEEKEKKLSKNKKFLLFGGIALILIILIVLLLIFVPSCNNEKEDECAVLTYSVNEDGEQQANIETDENGNITKTGDGTLITYDTNKITSINLDNEKGNLNIKSSTSTTTDENGEEKTDKTTYSIEGFEDLTLQEGTPDSIATNCANLSFTKVISKGDNLKEYGLEEPKAIVTTKFNDDTYSTIKVGKDAPQSAGVYITFGSNPTVYLITKDIADTFMYGILDLVSLSITDTAADTEGTSAQRITLSGNHFDDNIVLKENDDEAIDSSYVIISPVNQFANETESTNIANSFRGLFGTKAVCVNPDSEDLEKYNLSSPYAKANAIFSDVTISLLSSDISNDTAYIMKEDGKIIYEIASSSIPWATTSLKKLQNEVVLSPVKECVSSITVSTSSDTYKINVETKTESVDDENGNTQDVTTTNASYDGKTLDETNFSTFFQNLGVMEISGEAENSSNNPYITLTYSYNNGRSDDTIVIYENNGNKYPVSLNSNSCGTLNKNYVTKLLENTKALVKGEAVEAV